MCSSDLFDPACKLIVGNYFATPSTGNSSSTMEQTETFFRCPSDTANYGGTLRYISYWAWFTDDSATFRPDPAGSVKSDLRAARRLVGRHEPGVTIWHDLAAGSNSGGSANHPDGCNALYLGGHVKSTNNSSTFDSVAANTLATVTSKGAAIRIMDDF